jgi:hypothetical protein
MRKPMLVSLAIALFVSVTALAQNAPKPANPEMTLTGCLQKGDEPGAVSITGEDGRSWELHSTAVKLDEHIGHQVKVTGTVTRESKTEEKKEGQVERAAGKEEYGDLRVSTLKMISRTCSK